MTDYTAQIHAAVFQWWAPEDLPTGDAAMRDMYVSYIEDTTAEGFARDLALSIPVDFYAIAALMRAAKGAA